MLRGCECFSLCTNDDVSRFFLRLPPLVTEAPSPWHGYLRRVYGALPPLPATAPLPPDDGEPEPGRRAIV